MQIAVQRPSAQILPFIARSAPAHRTRTNRLTMLDRIQALEWEVAHANPARARLEIHGSQFDDAPELGDYIGVYRADEPWLVWGATRNGASITVWHGPSGTDFGAFDSMKDALAALCAQSILPRAGRY